MSLVKNAIVKMDWDADGFYESKKDNSFVAAINVYETDTDNVPVIFINHKACLLWDPDYNRPVNREEFTELLHELVTSYGSDLDLEELPETAGAYLEISNGVSVDEDLAEEYSLTPEMQEDILNRIDDLNGYYETEEEDMA